MHPGHPAFFAQAVVDDRVMRGLTAAMVSPFYLKRFWNVVRGYALPRGVDRVVFDYAVNSGTTRAVTALQIAVGVKADGGMGVATIAAVSAYVRAKTGKALVAAVCSSRLAFLHTAKNRKTGALLWPTFGKGWKRRVDAICATAAQEAQ